MRSTQIKFESYWLHCRAPALFPLLQSALETIIFIPLCPSSSIDDAWVLPTFFKTAWVSHLECEPFLFPFGLVVYWQHFLEPECKSPWLIPRPDSACPITTVFDVSPCRVKVSVSHILGGQTNCESSFLPCHLKNLPPVCESVLRNGDSPVFLDLKSCFDRLFQNVGICSYVSIQHSKHYFCFVMAKLLSSKWFLLPIMC